MYTYDSDLMLQVLFVWFDTVAILRWDLSLVLGLSTTLAAHLGASSYDMRILESMVHDVGRSGDTCRETTL